MPLYRLSLGCVCPGASMMGAMPVAYNISFASQDAFFSR